MGKGRMRVESMGWVVRVAGGGDHGVKGGVADFHVVGFRNVLLCLFYSDGLLNKLLSY